MIAALRGTIIEKSTSEVLVDVNGVGFRVNCSKLVMAELPEEKESVSLRIRTVVREDALELFGFLSREEEAMFLLLTSVSKVGPKLAMSVLSGLPAPQLAAALVAGDLARLATIHGVGKKTAERLVVELKERAKPLVGASLGVAASQDLVSALLHLGYRPAQAELAARTAMESTGSEAPLEGKIRAALAVLRKAN